jgi:hypothetical protein
VESLPITRILAGGRSGSSRPVLAETPAGPRLVKLRGAAQGTGPLVAEWIVADLARALGLRVPARSLLELAAGTPTDDRDQELADLLAASVGPNLGFEVLPDAREFIAADVDAVDAHERAAILWLDRLVQNPDRTSRNPNLLWWEDRLWLIDHGAALHFQYDWPSVTESMPRTQGAVREPHVFEVAASAGEWPAYDVDFAARLPRATLEAAAGSVPDSFLEPMLRADVQADPPDALRRRRAAYVAYLWKRLQPPRAFATPGPTPRITPPPRRRPSWLG